MTACRKVTGLRSVRPEVKSAPVHPCLKCCLQAAASPCVFLPCHVPCSWGVCLWELLQCFAPCLGFRRQAVPWLTCCLGTDCCWLSSLPCSAAELGVWAAAGSLAHCSWAEPPCPTWADPVCVLYCMLLLRALPFSWLCQSPALLYEASQSCITAFLSLSEAIFVVMSMLASQAVLCPVADPLSVLWVLCQPFLAGSSCLRRGVFGFSVVLECH